MKWRSRIGSLSTTDSCSTMYPLLLSVPPTSTPPTCTCTQQLTFKLGSIQDTRNKLFFIQVLHSYSHQLNRMTDSLSNAEVLPFHAPCPMPHAPLNYFKKRDTHFFTRAGSSFHGKIHTYYGQTS
jgi:hypothetical protein